MPGGLCLFHLQGLVPVSVLSSHVIEAPPSPPLGQAKDAEHLLSLQPEV